MVLFLPFPHELCWSAPKRESERKEEDDTDTAKLSVTYGIKKGKGAKSVHRVTITWNERRRITIRITKLHGKTNNNEQTEETRSINE